MNNSDKTIADVREFWDSTPLFSGESDSQVGTPEFFEEHRKVYIKDVFAGSIDENLFFNINKDSTILDLGCGVGFWLIEFWNRGLSNITGADLSSNSLKIAEMRSNCYGAKIALKKENAECLSFPDQSFDHINCQGVIHHTPNTQQAINEIYRACKIGGTACISVYYRNIVLRNFVYMKPLVRLLGKIGAKMKGRGRDNIFSAKSVDEIVRLYDGNENPIGKSYTKREFIKMCKSAGFQVQSLHYHYFPARSLPFKIPKVLHSLLDRFLPFMIFIKLNR